MKLYKFSKLSSFLSVAIISSSLLTVGCSKEDNLQELAQCKVKISESNFTEAFKYCKKAAEQGEVHAQYNLGNMYADGKGVKQDYFKAFEWYQKAAEQGNADAQCFLGFMYQYGQGVKQDYFKAFEWWQKAAEQGDAEAQFNLGVMYNIGKGVKQD